MSRANQVRVTATLTDAAGNRVPLGIFEEREGGDTDSQETVYPLGGMGPRISLGGNVEVGNVTIRRLFDAAAQAQRKFIDGRVGKGTLTITEQPLDADGNNYGEPDVWTCTLKRFARPERAADSDDAAQVELEGTVVGRVA
jgi:hypothetical protein